MKVVVIPNAGEIIEIMSRYVTWTPSELDLASDNDIMQKMLEALAEAGFIVSHEVEVDAEVVASIERAATAPSSKSQHVRWQPRPRKLELGDDEVHQ